MFSKKVYLEDALFCKENNLCYSTKDLFHCKDFYLIMERFCYKISKGNTRFHIFLNEFFNDEGYVDVWRIPGLMLDIYNCNYRFHDNTLKNQNFIKNFPVFLGFFYNYFLSEYRPYLINETNLYDIKKSVFQTRVNQNLINLLFDSYCRIIENIEMYEKSAQEEKIDEESR